MMGDTFIQVKGAYGRRYSNLIIAKTDWNANLDFLMMNGHTYINRKDHEKFGEGRAVKITLGNGLWGDLA